MSTDYLDLIDSGMHAFLFFWGVVESAIISQSQCESHIFQRPALTKVLLSPFLWDLYKPPGACSCRAHSSIGKVQSYSRDRRFPVISYTICLLFSFLFLVMAEIDGTVVGNGNHGGVVLDIKDDRPPPSSNFAKEDSDLYFSVPFMQKLVAEMVGTYFLIFAGCSSVAVNLNFEKVVTLPGISIVWGLAVMVLVYSLGHISGAHFNPAVTLAFATCKRFPWKQVPAYVACQVIGSTLAAGTIRLIFQGKQDQFTGTLPAGSDLQSFVVEFIITFYLMFVISGVATDNRAIGELAGLAVGSTVLLNVMFAGPISGASMNPARSLGPAIVSHEYRGIWIYMVAPVLGAQAGAWVYNLIRYTDKPLREITKSASFLRSKA
ncbi:AQUAPORIN NIP2-1 [Salix viminalis]|uniref:AQUAPORIN NIP2-1 n=1 Tax=Salix viminalis TaxID=40686 RepID=A0A9Q0U7G2_SALVM|nr:AQUAPORIN NIP2-1 [Salix viminalis]